MSVFGSIVNVRQTPLAGAGTTARRPAITVPGFLWANLDDPDNPFWERYDGTSWVPFSASAPTLPAWALAGNALAGGEKLGATNNQPVIMYQNNAERFRLANSGSWPMLGTGAAKFTGLFRIDNTINGNFIEFDSDQDNPWIRLLDSGHQDVYIISSAVGGVLIASNSAGTSFMTVRVQNLIATGGTVDLNNATGNSLLSMACSDTAGSVSYILLSTTSVPKWVIGTRQGAANTQIEFRQGANNMGNGTLRFEIIASSATLPGGGIRFNGATIITEGNGSPESVVTAPPGSLYLNNAGGAGTSLYVKESGSGNTGWIAK